MSNYVSLPVERRHRKSQAHHQELRTIYRMPAGAMW